MSVSTFLKVFTLLRLLVIVVSHNHRHHRRRHHHHGQEAAECGTEAPSKMLAALDFARGNLLKQKQHGRKAQAQSCEELCNQCIEVEVYAHLMMFAGKDFDLDFDFIPHPTPPVQALLDDGDRSLTADNFTTKEEMIDLISLQVFILNRFFNETPFFFTHMEPDNPSVTVNTEWARYGFSYFTGMSRALSRGDLRTLNLYFGYTMESLGEEPGNSTTLAFGRFPSFQMNATGDGINQRYDVLPGGGRKFRDLGMTTVHETGHWLGLYHTFQNEGSDPCSTSNIGDRIDDTPTQANETYLIVDDCKVFLEPDPPPFPDTCPELDGVDPVFNFMNYLNDQTCFVVKGEFTCQQKERMNWQWQLYRDGLPICDVGEMEVIIYIKFEEKDQKWSDNFHIISTAGQTIFNSTTDYTSWGIEVYDRKIILVALCLQDDDYEFIYNDREGNGFASDPNAFIMVFKGNETLAVISGNFGSQVKVEINQVPAPVPVPVPVPVPAPAPAPVPAPVPAPSPLPAPIPAPVPAPPVPSPVPAPRPHQPIPGKGKGYYQRPMPGKGGNGYYPVKKRTGYYYHSHGGKGHYPHGMFQTMKTKNYFRGHQGNGGYYRMTYGQYYGRGMGGGRYYGRPRRAGWW